MNHVSRCLNVGPGLAGDTVTDGAALSASVRCACLVSRGRGLSLSLRAPSIFFFACFCSSLPAAKLNAEMEADRLESLAHEHHYPPVRALLNVPPFSRNDGPTTRARQQQQQQGAQ